MPTVQEMEDYIVSENDISSEGKKRDVLSSNSLYEMCLKAKYYKLNAQFWGKGAIEPRVKTIMGLDAPPNAISGDASKAGENYEIKASMCDKTLNYVQIRPDHNVHWYILIGFFIQDNRPTLRTLKVPSDKIYELVVKYGGYAHGTVGELGTVRQETIRGNNNEYSLRPKPNGNPGTKPRKLWDELVQYAIEL